MEIILAEMHGNEFEYVENSYFTREIKARFKWANVKDVSVHAIKVICFLLKLSIFNYLLLCSYALSDIYICKRSMISLPQTWKNQAFNASFASLFDNHFIIS